MTMLQWETVHGRDRAVSGKREYRVFYGPEEARHALPWTLVIREIGKMASTRTFSTSPTPRPPKRRKPLSNGKASH